MRLSTHTASRCEFLNDKGIIAQGVYFIHGCSGEYAPEFSNNTIHVAILIIDAMMSRSFLTTSTVA